MKHKTKPNSWVYQSSDATTQLSYALQIDPAPFTVATTGSLEFVVTNPTENSLMVSSVTFIIEAGSTSTCLTATTASILTDVSDTTDWIITGPVGPVTNGSASYTLGPATGTSVMLAAGASVVVQLYQIQTNSLSGNSVVNIKEIVGETPAFTQFLVSTFPTGFYFNGLAANVQSGSNLVPVAQVNANSTVTLTWNASLADISAFAIQYSNASLGQQTASLSDIGEWTSPPLSSDTIFTVIFTTNLTGGQPLTASLSTAVSVQNPSLVAASLNTGTAVVTGNATINGTTTTNAIVADGVTVNGAVNSESATISGAVEVGSLGVSGALQATSLGVSGASTLSSAVVSGQLSVSGGLTANAGPVSLMSQGTMLAQGVNLANTFIQALTDGFAVITIQTPSDCTDMCYNYGNIYASGNWFSFSGGNAGQFGPGWDYFMGSNPNSLAIPIFSGSTWGYSTSSASDNQSNANSQVWWFPMGNPAAAQETYRVMAEEECRAIPPAPVPSLAMMTQAAENRTKNAEAFIKMLAESFKISLPTETKTELTKLLRQL